MIETLIFVPDGSRRMVLANTDYDVNSKEFFKNCFELPCKSLLKSLNVLFNNGIKNLIIPVLSKAVIEKRGDKYKQYTINNLIETVFNGESYLHFYNKYDIRVNFYGNIKTLEGSIDKKYIDYIYKILDDTKNNNGPKLFFGIGENPWLSATMVDEVIKFYEKYHKKPSREELIKEYYGFNLPYANAFILSSKMSSLGASPIYLIDGNTEFYFLSAPIGDGLTNENFQKILADYKKRENNRKAKYMREDFSLANRKKLKEYFKNNKDRIIGIGHEIGNSWTL